MSTTRWTRIAILVGCLLLAGSAAARDAAPADDLITEDWWSEVSAEIGRMEYRVTHQERSVISGHPGGLHVTNRAQGLRAYFLADGVDIVPRDAQEPPWTLRLALRETGSSTSVQNARAAEPSSSDSTVTYRRGDVTERWENTPQGIVIGLSLPHDAAEAVFDLDTDLQTIASADGSEVRFYHEGVPVGRLTLSGVGGRLAIDDDSLRISIPDVPALLANDDVMPVELEAVLNGSSSGGGAQTGLSLTPDWTAEGDQEGARFGWSVGTAGDVNGDGYSDVIVEDESAAFVYLGSASGLETSAAWTAEVAASVATAGDVNGDGYSDVIVGDGFAAFVYLGSASGLETSAAWTAEGDQECFGCSVATAGDVNGDGYSDVIVGASVANTVFVYLGSASGLETSAAWTAEGDQEFSSFGSSIATAGDVNGDGYSDVIVGAPNFDGAEGGEGAAFVYLGSASGLETSAAWTDESPGFGLFSYFGTSVATAGDVNGDGYSDVIVSGRASFVYLGSASGLSDPHAWDNVGDDSVSWRSRTSVATAGDVNGDGYSDVIVGVEGVDFGGAFASGAAFVYLGSASGLSNSESWIADGQPDSGFGFSVATAGDVNGDGYSDVIVGALGFDNGVVESAGAAFVYLGSASALSPSADWTNEDDSVSWQFGTTVATAGDVNGDGYSDVIVGAPFFDGGEGGEGAAFVYLGSASGLSMSAAWIAEGDQQSARFGSSVATAGDVNGDGYSDVIVGAPLVVPVGNGAFSGAAFVYLGSASGLSMSAAWIAEDDRLDATGGISVATAGDVNGDGYSDVIVGVEGADFGWPFASGAAFVYLGSASGLSNSESWIADGQPDSNFGSSVATAGDVNGDGYSDVIVGAPAWGGGAAFVYLGSASGLSNSESWIADGQPDSGFGEAVATAGDVNGDGYSDVIVGAGYFVNEAVEEGAAFVYLGSASGLSTSAAWTAEDGQAFSDFGSSVATAGDVNGDGYSDVIVGAPFFDGGEGGEGAAFVYLGSASGLSMSAAWIAEGDQQSARFGSSVATAGDVNGDGYSDVIVGKTGAACVYLGNSSLGRGFHIRQIQADGSPIGLRGKSDSTAEFRIVADLPSFVLASWASLEWEIAPLGYQLDGTGLTGSELVDVPQSSEIVALIDSLEQGTFYHWRARVVTDSPAFPRSPWFSMPGNNITETKLRTWGLLPEAMFRVLGPAPNEELLADSNPAIFSWQTGGATRFRLEWSRNPQFAPPSAVVSEDFTADHPAWGIHRPDDSVWRSILQVVPQVDFQPTSIFWRVIPLDGSQAGIASPFRALRLKEARGPIVTSPADGATVNSRPEFTWEANHNNRYQIRFSANSHIGDPRLIFGQAYDLYDEPLESEEVNWLMDDQQWNDVVCLASNAPDGRVYYVVLAKDALDRTSFGPVRSLVVSDTCTQVDTQVETGRREPPDRKSSAYKKKSLQRTPRRR